MTIPKPTSAKDLEKAFDSFSDFQKKGCCNHLRSLIHKAFPDIDEEWKWGANFTLNGPLCEVSGFKKDIKLTFFKGSLLQDKYQLFNDGEDRKGNCSITFTEDTEIDDDKITEYLREAAALNKLEAKLEKKHNQVEVPEELTKALHSSGGLKMYFEKLAPSRRREYADYIDDATDNATRERRIKKVIEIVAEDKKLHEKFEQKKKHKKRKKG